MRRNATRTLVVWLCSELPAQDLVEISPFHTELIVLTTLDFPCTDLTDEENVYFRNIQLFLRLKGPDEFFQIIKRLQI